jgi:hypothetical protein
MDALVNAAYLVTACFVIGFGGLLIAYLRCEQANERLRWLLDRTESDLAGARRQVAVFRTMVTDLQVQNTAAALQRANPVATRSQQPSQEMQLEAPDVVRVLPVAASRLAKYVQEQAMANGQTMSDYDAEQMAAAMLVESGI